MAASGTNKNNGLSDDTTSGESSADTFIIPSGFEADVSRIFQLCPYGLDVEEVVEKLKGGEDPLDIVCWWRANIYDGREWEEEVESRMRGMEERKRLLEEERK